MKPDVRGMRLNNFDSRKNMTGKNAVWKLPDFLPATRSEMDKMEWARPDVVLVTGDAYADHPSFPAALLGRVLEAAGFRTAILARPDVNDTTDFMRFGLPRLFFGVTSGALDSMVANYTAQKRGRSDDPYAPGGEAGGRPDRAVTVYCNRIRQAYGKAAVIVAGGIEAGLRRFTHYDFWSDSIRRPLLMDCGADLIVHGMGEGPICAIASTLEKMLDANPQLAKNRAAGKPLPPETLIGACAEIPGVVYRIPRSAPEKEGAIRLPSYEDSVADPKAFAHSFNIMETKRNATLQQDCSGMRVISNPPWPPHSSDEMDRIYSLPFRREAHPIYTGKAIPALEQVRFSITSHRGCFGGCAFCAISAHQGKTIQSRSAASVLEEIRRMTAHAHFKGVINDIGGPTANMYGLGCKRGESCERPSCLWPDRCRHLNTDQSAYVGLLKRAGSEPGVRHLFVTTGIRMDLARLSEALIERIAAHHTGGHLKVAPEHTSPRVLRYMRKPLEDHFKRFLDDFRRISRRAGKEQYAIPYMMAAHPGCTMKDMIELALFLRSEKLPVEQCQIFTPTPGTASGVMYATGLDPATLKPVFVERSPQRREMQKALILNHLPESSALIKKALTTEGRSDLIPQLTGRVSRQAHAEQRQSRKPESRSGERNTHRKKETQSSRKSGVKK